MPTRAGKNIAVGMLHAYRGGDITSAMVDWTQLLQRLKARGWTQVQLAAHVGATQSTISELSNGKAKEPRYSVASALIALDASKLSPPNVAPAPDTKAEAA